ncbi:TetR/AcrR family transcriptional regulator [Myxococcus faecalis]|jgi:AcrR family transcriptional regulator|uniref:TetR/AcrR family transcriptional regulator n=1 Tax=Myxococcus TaxID=32 RepID=UPI001CC079D7|nr:TetR/AcrR family transcriptional regulator [Myxococcus sp. AS-1-15]MBZ4401725.1 TetR/AcrR family transcriptional regulator [Myxococcus sp. AS-1-15]BDT35650.1 TetR/AcrR family transcriptional regulator [Myxococcus sp. MH1]
MSPSPAPRWKRLEPDERREQILEVATRLFGERPYADVSTTDIAKEAGVARGLLNHYFGQKRDLYLKVVKRMLLMPGLEEKVSNTGTLRERVERSVRWYLDTVATHGKTYVAVTAVGGIGADPEVERIISAADDVAAAKTLEFLGLKVEVGSDARHRAMMRSYSGMVKATIREWIRGGTLTREEAHLLLSESLITLVRDVIPQLKNMPPRAEPEATPAPSEGPSDKEP